MQALGKRLMLLLLILFFYVDPLFSAPNIPGDWTAYVSNLSSDSVNAIDIPSGTINATIGGVIANPSAIAFTADGTRIYVANIQNNSVSVIDRATQQLITQIPLNTFINGRPVAITINSTSTTAYVVTHNQDPTNPGMVIVIDTTTNTVTSSIPVGHIPEQIALISNAKAYVTNRIDNSVSVINLMTNAVSTTITGVLSAFGITYNPITSLAYVTSFNTPGLVTEINGLTDTIVTPPSPISLGGTAASQGIVVNPTGTLAYIANILSDNVSVLNLTTNNLVMNIPVGIGPSSLAINATGSRVYVGNTNSNDISVIDTATNTVIATVGVGNNPNDITLTPDGTQLYVANLLSNSISIIDTATNTVVSTINGVFNGPSILAINPTATFVYVPNFNSTTLSVIDIATNQVVLTITGLNNPNVVAITPDGTRAYVTNNVSPGNVSAIDLTTNTVIATIPVGDFPFGIAITPDGTKAYVANPSSSTISILDLTTNTVIGTIPFTPPATPNFVSITPDGTKTYVSDAALNVVYVINLADNTLITTIPVGIAPQGIAITPDGTLAYVANSNSNSISVINTTANTVIDTLILNVNSTPQTISITPDGRLAYITDSSLNQVIVVDVATNTIIDNIPVGMFPFGIAITPDQAPVASFTISANAVVGQPILFNGSSSTTAVGTIVSYTWNFGDGTIVTTASSTITHVYAASGSYTVTLTVVNSAGTSTTKVFTGQTLSRNGGPTATASQNLVVSPFIPLLPPKHVRGFQEVNRFATQSDYINVLKWRAPSTGITPVAYQIYRNAALTHLIKTVSANHQLEFKDHNRKKNKTYVYYIVSVDAAGNKSQPAIITVHPKK